MNDALAQENKKIMVYQLLPRLFGNQHQQNIPWGTIEQNGSGKFADINGPALDGIKELGTTHVWFTGVIAHATLTSYNDTDLAANNANVVKGRAGSPYAVRDYYDVDPDLAVEVKNRMGEFEELIRRTHAKGLKVIIDFVPNHVARQYRSYAKPAGVKDFGEGDDVHVAFSAANDFYYVPGKDLVVPSLKAEQHSPLGELQQQKYVESPAKATGNNVFSEKPGIDDWYETVKLNYGVDYENHIAQHFNPTPEVWTKMRDILVYWTDKGVDGFRCDMAEMVPLAFWGWVIPEVKKVKPGLIFIGEAYDPSTYKSYLTTGQFDYLYDKVGLYDGLKKLIRSEEHADVNDIRKVWQVESAGFGDQMLRFLENHDEERIASNGFAGRAELALPAMVVSATLSGGPVMTYFGQEVGEPARGAEGFGGEDNRTTIFDYWGVPEHQKWMNGGAFDGGQLGTAQKALRDYYVRLLQFTASSAALAKGEFWEIPVNGNMNKRMYGYVRYTATQRLLILVNFDRHYRMEGQVQIPERILQHKPFTHAEDKLSDLKINDIKENKIPVWVLPMSAQILEF
ncbi:alpha-amylase family protein [Pedobacter sp. MR2016-24]|uniref:alpha-amylase family protein n=1 Tax=Pedobacter sp. MR2016-24 TaxID=2994466 RepID=UPI002245E5FC|nr:alpha-amylase family protein [Pedobacter sp. MR2016-24]MCX2482418.1 alpha-amylase family protein [Pedobacter sp. MR2016-24]